MSNLNEIESTLSDVFSRNANESTDSPYWLLIDPSGNNIKTKVEHIAGCITGPFFSREDAESYLKDHSYNYSKRAMVWCASGYHSMKYKIALRNIMKGIHVD